MNQTTTGFASVNNATLYYESCGHGFPLVLLHAGVADQRMWDQQVDAFSAHYHVIRFDMRDSGQSLMTSGRFSFHGDGVGLLDNLGIDKAILLGSSFGSLVALNIALAFPERVAGLILCAPSVDGEEPSERLRQFWREEGELVEQGDLDAATELNLRLWVDGPQRRPDQVDATVRERVRQMQRAIFGLPQVEGVEVEELDPPAIDRLAAVTQPTQVIIGLLDMEEKVAVAQQLAQELPNARYAALANAAHMLNMEEPDEFNRIVLAFLNEIAPYP